MYNTCMASKLRLDVLLIERGMVASRSLAQRMVMAGQVRVDGQVAMKASTKVAPDAAIEIDEGPRYVSRGGEKLEAALDEFTIAVEGLICADVGASMGGFTDCLLQHGVKKVYAIDVGKGQLDWKLRQDERVEVMEETNARYVEKLSEGIDLVTIDASFISLKVLLPVVRGWFGENGGQVIALIKPQFEAGREAANKGKGVIRDPEVRNRAVSQVLKYAHNIGFDIRRIITSPLIGPKGNTEYLVNMNYPLILSGLQHRNNLPAHALAEVFWVRPNENGKVFRPPFWVFAGIFEFPNDLDIGGFDVHMCYTDFFPEEELYIDNIRLSFISAEILSSLLQPGDEFEVWDGRVFCKCKIKEIYGLETQITLCESGTD